jgi:hypothetical protein
MPFTFLSNSGGSSGPIDVTDVIGLTDALNLKMTTTDYVTNNKIITTYLDPLAITSTIVVDDNTARDALITNNQVQEGDVCIVTTTQKSYILNSVPQWVELTSNVAQALINLTDIQISTLSSNDNLFYNGSGKWVNKQPKLVFLSDVTIFDALENQILKIGLVNGNPHFSNTALSMSSGIINDVLINSPTNGQLLQWNGTKWVNSTVNNPISLSALSDVNINTPANNDILVYNTISGKWLNNVSLTNYVNTLTNASANNLILSKTTNALSQKGIIGGSYITVNNNSTDITINFNQVPVLSINSKTGNSITLNTDEILSGTTNLFVTQIDKNNLTINTGSVNYLFNILWQSTLWKKSITIGNNSSVQLTSSPTSGLVFIKSITNVTQLPISINSTFTHPYNVTSGLFNTNLSTTSPNVFPLSAQSHRINVSFGLPLKASQIGFMSYNNAHVNNLTVYGYGANIMDDLGLNTMLSSGGMLLASWNATSGNQTFSNPLSYLFYSIQGTYNNLNGIRFIGTTGLLEIPNDNSNYTITVDSSNGMPLFNTLGSSYIQYDVNLEAVYARELQNRIFPVIRGTNDVRVGNLRISDTTLVTHAQNSILTSIVLPAYTFFASDGASGPDKDNYGMVPHTISNWRSHTGFMFPPNSYTAVFQLLIYFEVPLVTAGTKIRFDVSYKMGKFNETPSTGVWGIEGTISTSATNQKQYISDSSLTISKTSEPYSFFNMSIKRVAPLSGTSYSTVVNVCGIEIQHKINSFGFVV